MIYFTRHGESQANVDGLFAGPRYPAPLTDEGRNQARLEAGRIRDAGIVIGCIMASPLPRTQETAVIIADTIGFDPTKIHYDKRLIEYDMGVLDGKSAEGVSAHQLVSSEGAEEPQAFQDRVMASIEEALTLPVNTLFVSHAGVGRIIEAVRIAADPQEFYNLPDYPNAQVISLDWLTPSQTP